jgi:hypothetical protein
MGEAERVDRENRGRWLACINAHNEALQCLTTLQATGLLAAPKGR